MNSIYVFDAETAEYLGEVDAYTSWVLKRSWQGIGDAQITMDSRCAGADLLQVGRIVTAGNAWHKAVLLTGEKLEARRGGHTRTLTGMELKGIANRRLTVPPTAQEDENVLGYDRVSGAGEAVLRHYVSRHMVSPSSDYRRFPLLQMEEAASPLRGKETPWQTRYEKLGDVLTDIAEWCDLGWNIALDYPNRRWLFTVDAGRDLTVGNGSDSFVAFEEDFHNLTEASYSHDRSSYCNALYLGGAGEDEKRLVLVRYVDEDHALLTEPLSGLSRAETLIDTGNLSLPGEVEYEGLHKYVSSFKPLRTLTAQISPAGPWKYEEDWDLGDKVTVQLRDPAVGLDVRLDARILAVEETRERGGLRLSVTFGKEEPTIGDALRGMQREPVK